MSHPEGGLSDGKFLNLLQRKQKQTSAFCGQAFVQPWNSVCRRQCELYFPCVQRGFLINIHGTQRQTQASVWPWQGEVWG